MLSLAAYCMHAYSTATLKLPESLSTLEGYSSRQGEEALILSWRTYVSSGPVHAVETNDTLKHISYV